MRVSLKLLLVLSPLLFVIPPTPSYAVSISRDDMNNVCGKDAKTGGGHTGCDKTCGTQVCDYDCDNKTNKCQGMVVGAVKSPSQGIRSGPTLPPASLSLPAPGGGSGPPPKGKGRPAGAL